MDTPIRRRYILLDSDAPGTGPATIVSDLPPGSVVAVGIDGGRRCFRLTATRLDGGLFAAESADRYL